MKFMVLVKGIVPLYRKVSDLEFCKKINTTVMLKQVEQAAC